MMRISPKAWIRPLFLLLITVGLVWVFYVGPGFSHTTWTTGYNVFSAIVLLMAVVLYNVVLSYPGPDRSIRIELLRAGNVAPLSYRNRRIGEFLKELDLTEGCATGITKMLRAMRLNGSQAPTRMVNMFPNKSPN